MYADVENTKQAIKVLSFVTHYKSAHIVVQRCWSNSVTEQFRQMRCVEEWHFYSISYMQRHMFTKYNLNRFSSSCYRWEQVAEWERTPPDANRPTSTPEQGILANNSSPPTPLRLITMSLSSTLETHVGIVWTSDVITALFDEASGAACLFFNINNLYYYYYYSYYTTTSARQLHVNHAG